MYVPANIDDPFLFVLPDYSEPPVKLKKAGTFLVEGSSVQSTVKPYGVLTRKVWTGDVQRYAVKYLHARPFGGWQCISGLIEKKGKGCILVTFDVRAARDRFFEEWGPEDSVSLEVVGEAGTGMPE